MTKIELYQELDKVNLPETFKIVITGLGRGSIWTINGDSRLS